VKLNRSLVAACLVLILAFSLVALLQRQTEIDLWAERTQAALAQELTAKVLHLLRSSSLPHYDNSAFWAASVLPQGTLAEKATLPENTSRTAIYSFINNNPGVQFRAICSGLGLSIGVVQFHLAQLQKSGLITSFRKGRYKRFFVAGRFSHKQTETIATLRLQTVKNILRVLLDRKRVSHHELAVRLSISSQGLTWQMNRLRETGLIQENRNGLNVTYTIGQASLPLVTQAITITENGKNSTQA
jgi:DNA-binding transcriptional ArsR family regulator